MCLTNSTCTATSRLASHAAAAGALGSVLELPFESEMERALLAWLGQHGGVHPGAAGHLPVVYHLMRGGGGAS
jgi:hypothetical protein